MCIISYVTDIVDTMKYIKKIENTIAIHVQVY